MEKSKSFLERNFPMIYLYGKGTADSDDQVAKVRIAFSRERDERSRLEKAEGEWTCKIVSSQTFCPFHTLLTLIVHVCQLPWSCEMFQVSKSSNWYVEKALTEPRTYISRYGCLCKWCSCKAVRIS